MSRLNIIKLQLAAKELFVTIKVLYQPCSSDVHVDLGHIFTHEIFLAVMLTFMRRSRKFCQRGSNIDNAFFSFLFKLKSGSAYHYKRAIIGTPGKRHKNGVLLVCL